MADIGKMWFEMGVRDTVTDQMRQAVQAAQQLGTSIDNIIKNADRLTQALYRIGNIRERISNAAGTAKSLGFDTSRLDEGLRLLDEFEKKLSSISAQDFADNSTAVSRELNAEYREMVRSLAQAAREQEKLNTARMRDTARTEAQSNREAAQAALANAQAQEKLISKFDQLTEAGRRSQGMMGQMKNQLLAYASFAGISSMVHDVITIGGEFEKQHIALKSILGDAQEATTMFSQIKSLAVVSPFSFRELATYTKQLAAFNIPYNELYDTSKRLADMSAGLGVDMDRLILAYGQVRSASVLRGQELRQFTEAGIPMVQALADKFTELNGKVTTTGDVFKLIQQRAVPFEMVKDVLWDMTNEGGKFYNMQYVLADTLSGKWSNLRDAWEIMLSDFAKGESVSGKVLKGMVGGVTELISSMNTLLPVIASFGAAWGSMKVYRGAQNLWHGGLDSASRTFLSAKQDMARDIAQKRYLQGEAALSATEQRILMTKNQITAADYRTLAASGRLNALELQRLFSQGKIGAAQIRHLATMKLITAEEKAQILNGNAMALAWGKVRASMGSIFTAGNAVILAITAAISIAMHFYEKSQEYAQAADDMAQDAKNRYQELESLMNGQKSSKPSSNEDYTKQIDQMEDLLSQYDKNYAAVMREAGAQTTLAGKYNVLKDELDAVTAAYKDAGDNKRVFEDLEKSTDGWFSEPMKENMSEWADANAAVQKSLNDLNKNGIDGLDKALASLAGRMPQYRSKIYGKDGKQLNPLEGLENVMNTARTGADVNKLFYEDLLQYRDKNWNANKNSLWWKLSNDERQAFSKYLQEARARIDAYNDLKPQIEQAMDKTADAAARHFDLTRAQFDKLVKDGYRTQDANLKDKIGENGRNAKTYIANYFNSMMSHIGDYGKELEQYVDAHSFQLRFHYTISETYEKEDQLFGNARSAWEAISGGRGPVRDSSHRQGFSKKDIEDAFGSSGTDVVNARKKLSGKIQEQDAFVKQLKKTKSATRAQIEQAEALLRAYKADWRKMFTDNAEDVNKSTGLPKKPHKDSSSDKELQAFKKKVQLYKRFYEEYKENVKLYGADALKKLEESGKYKTVFGWKLKDLTDFEGSMEALGHTIKHTTEERKEFADSMNADIQAENRKKETEGIRDANEALKTQLELLAEQYDTYKKIYELTGDSEGAAGIAFSGKAGSPTLKAALESKMQESMGSKSWMTAQEALSLGRNAFVERFGESGGLLEYYDAWHKNEDKLKKESYDLMADLLKNHRTLEQQIEDENRSYERQLELLNSNKTLTDKMRERAKAGLTEDHEKKQSKLLLDQFKRRSDWVTIFDDMNRVSTKTIRTMMGMVDAESRKTGLAPEDVKTLRDALEKLRGEMAKRDPVGMMRAAISQAGAIRDFIGDPHQKSYAEANRDQDGNARYAVTEDDGRRMGIRAGNYTQAQMETFLAAAEQDFANGIQGLSAMFNTCAEALDPVVELFDALGDSDVSEFVKGGQKALGAAASTAGAFSTLSKSFGEDSPVGKALGAAGPYAAAAAAGLSIVSSLLSSKPASMKIYEKQAEYLKDIQGTVKDINGSLKDRVSAAHGSEAQTAGRKIDENLKLEAREVRETYYDWSMAKKHHGGNRNRMKTNLDFDQINRYLRSMGYRGEVIGGDNIQKLSGKDLEQIREHFAGMWAQMPEDARKYLERLIEIEGEQGELTQNTQNMVEALSGMKLDTMKSDYVSLLNDLNGSNYQFARKFEDYLKNAILNGLVADRYKGKLKEIIDGIDAAGRNEYYTKTDGTVGVKQKVNGQYVTPGDLLSEYTAAELAEQKKKYTDLGKKARGDTDMLRRVFGFSNDSSSLTNIGTSITEDTASLLLSYVNAIRGDESVSLKYIRRYVEELCPQGNNLLAQQIAIQKSIEANTHRSADGVDAIRGYLDSVIKGTKKLHMT